MTGLRCTSSAQLRCALTLWTVSRRPPGPVLFPSKMRKSSGALVWGGSLGAAGTARLLHVSGIGGHSIPCKWVGTRASARPLSKVQSIRASSADDARSDRRAKRMHRQRMAEVPSWEAGGETPSRPSAVEGARLRKPGPRFGLLGRADALTHLKKGMVSHLRTFRCRKVTRQEPSEMVAHLQMFRAIVDAGCRTTPPRMLCLECSACACVCAWSCAVINYLR